MRITPPALSLLIVPFWKEECGAISLFFRAMGLVVMSFVWFGEDGSHRFHSVESELL